MTASTADHVELVDHLVTVVAQRVLDPLVILLESDDAVAAIREHIGYDAEMWAAQLLDGEDPVATARAARLLAALYPGDEPFDPPAAWWQTPLGRVVARRVGHPGADRVSLAVAGAMLGVTRQGVHDLVTRGKLARHPEGGVTTESVRKRIKGES